MNLTIPLPPSSNAAWRSVVGARKEALFAAVDAYRAGADAGLPLGPLWRGIMDALFVNVTKSEEYLRFEAEARVMLEAQPTDVLEGEVVVSVVIFFKDRRRDMAGNVEKVLFDTLEGWCYRNDKQICEQHIFRRYDAENPRCEVSVVPVEPELFTSEEIERTGELPF